jgi:hypothetical protein
MARAKRHYLPGQVNEEIGDGARFSCINREVMNYIVITLLSLFFASQIAYAEQKNNYPDYLILPNEDEVIIRPHLVSIPLGKILLVRKDSTYCAIKLVRIGLVNAEYVSYYQSDKSGNFNKENVEIKNGKLLAKEPVGIGRFAFAFGQKIDIECGPLELMWSGRRSIHFYSSSQDERRYSDIELAPTPWGDISQVNVFDPRVKWYWYDEKRKTQVIPIDKLWPETEPTTKSDPAKP